MNTLALSPERPAVAVTRGKPAVPVGEETTAAVRETDVEEPEQEKTQTETESLVESAVERTRREIVFEGRSLEFRYDKEFGRVIVRVRSQESGEVVRQIPQDQFLKLAAQFKELAGILFNQTV